jgi:predicted dehydrogenase
MVQVAAVGLGAWGWGVARNFYELKDCELVACCDVDAKRRDAATSAWPGTLGFANFDEMLRKTPASAVAIAAPAVMHYELTKKALLADRDVLVEKPFTLNVRDAEELAELADKRNRVLMVGHLLEYHPVVRRLRKLVRSGELGPIYYIYSQRVNLGRIRGDENAMWSFAPHDLSVLMYLLDMEPADVSVRGQSFIQNGIEDVVFMSLFFDNRIMAHIHLSWLDPHKIRRTTVVGAKRMAVFDDIEVTEKLRIYDNYAEVPPAATYGEAIQVRFGDILIPRVETSEPLKVECQHFVECVRTRRKPLTDSRSGIRVVRILEAAQRSLEHDGTPVSIWGSTARKIRTSNGEDRCWHAVGV